MNSWFGDTEFHDTSPEISKEGDAILNSGLSVDFPTLPSTEVFAPVENQGFSKFRSGSDGSSCSVEQHLNGCECATCVAVVRDLDEVRDVFRRFEGKEEQEEAQEKAQVPMNRTSRRLCLLGRR
ncbi:hypothetical protein K501DRAFT_275320 [Backusella circina FSU 941]|nr:hypothetical protein K501DRAFT_275320 [Backusella circina FSU 941]